MAKRHLIGTIASVKMHETARVRVERHIRHRLYGKRFRVTTTYLSHNPNNTYQLGDIVEIEEHRPFSKNKQWLIRRQIGNALPTLEATLVEPTTRELMLPETHSEV